MKKLLIYISVVMVFLLPITTTYSEQKAYANVVSKPISITAKKVAKELAMEAAFQTVGNLALKLSVDNYDNHKVEQGFKPICLIGGKTDINDCPPEEKAQVKADLTSADKSKLNNKVEEVLERKTNTSSKWAKFLDWFVPIFLISGLVAMFDAMLDGDSQGLIDEIALEALKESNLILPLNSTATTTTPIYNWGQYVSKIELVETDNSSYSLIFSMKNSNDTILIKSGDKDLATIINGRKLTVGITGNSKGTQNNLWGAMGIISTFHNGISFKQDKSHTVYETEFAYKSFGDARVIALDYTHRFVYNATFSNDLNTHANNFLGLIQLLMNEPVTTNLTPLEVPPVKPNIDNIRPSETIKDEVGNTKIPGIESFTYTYNNTNIYPSSESLTGWKDKATNLDISVVEDEVIVDGDKLEEDEPPADDDTPDTNKDKQKLKEKSREWSQLLTTRFPFSLPWDFLHMMKFLYAEPITPHWEIKGTEKIPFNLKLNLAFFDPYAPWFRTFILLSFIMTVIFLHGRFMGGSK